MGFLDNLEEQLKKSKEIQELDKLFKKTKVKHLKLKKETRKGYIDRKIQNKEKRLLKRKKFHKARKYRRCPKKYDTYIKSNWWVRRKNIYYQQHQKICQACLSTKYINLHHMVYGNFGNEKDEHLVALCRNCHEEYHALNGVRGNMVKYTNEFIAMKRELLDFPKF